MRNYRRHRKGMVLVVALLIMAIMSIIGASAITTSRIDIQISNNTKISRQAFYAADGGIEQSPKYIRDMASERAVSAVPNYVVLSGDLLDEIMGMTPCALCDAADYVHTTQSGIPGGPNGPDFTITLPGSTVLMDVDRDKARLAPGSSSEMFQSDAGAGGGSMGGIFIYYDIHSVEQGPNGPGSYLDVYYRYVVGLAGGK